MGARTEYGGLQNNNNNVGHHGVRNRQGEQNPLETQGSNFIAVQDSSLDDQLSQPHHSPIVSTNIGGGKARNIQQRQITESEKSQSHGRTSQ